MYSWYIYTQNTHYGPYTSKQMLDMYNNGQIDPSSSIYSQQLNSYVDIKDAHAMWLNDASGINIKDRNISVNKKSKKWIPITIILTVLVAVAAFFLFNFLKPNKPLKLGASKKLVSSQINSSGGVITVDDMQSSLNGLTLTVPHGAYSKQKNFKISQSPITSANIENVEFITPLISIDNGHEFSNKAMTLKIPIQLDEGMFAMAFYYDKKTGTFEGIPSADLGSDSITLYTHHFSDIAVVQAERKWLVELDLHTGFMPGIDDWQFKNLGSFLAPYGHCAGQSLTSMYYYTEVHLAQNKPHLYGLYDNNGHGGKTPAFQFDDSWGYRFASVAQEELIWLEDDQEDLYDHLSQNPDRVFPSFALSMYMSEEPQFVFILTDDSSSAHAIVAYAIKDKKLYVADPNYPGASDRYISYIPAETHSGVFSAYNSGANAQEIADSGTIVYDKFIYLAKTALIDYSGLADNYKLMLKGKVGDNYFPEYEILYLKEVNARNNKETWVKLPEYLDLSSEDTLRAGEDMRGRLKIKFVNKSNQNMRFSRYDKLNSTTPLLNMSVGENDEVTTIIDLEAGINHEGYYIQHLKFNKLQYTDFYRCKIEYDKQIDIQMDANIDALAFVKRDFSAKVSDIPKDVQLEYVWDFGDGKDQITTQEPSVEYQYNEEGDYLLLLHCIDKQTQKTLGVQESYVTVTNLIGAWNLQYTITESFLLDKLIGEITKMIENIFSNIFGDLYEPSDEVITMKGVTISGDLNIFASSDGKLSATYIPRDSSHPDVDVVDDDVYTGAVTIGKDNKISISLKSEEDPFIFFLKGFYSDNLIEGDVNASLYKAVFVAFR